MHLAKKNQIIFIGSKVPLKNRQNGTFEPMHETWNFFWPKPFFWSIMKLELEIELEKIFITCPRGRQIQELCRKKYQKGIV